MARKATKKKVTKKSATKTAAAKTAAKKESVPAGDRQTSADAQDLVLGQPCPLTEECPGTIKVYNEQVRAVRDDDGNVIASDLHQFLNCTHCDRLPENPRIRRGARRFVS